MIKECKIFKFSDNRFQNGDYKTTFKSILSGNSEILSEILKIMTAWLHCYCINVKAAHNGDKEITTGSINFIKSDFTQMRLSCSNCQNKGKTARQPFIYNYKNYSLSKSQPFEVRLNKVLINLFITVLANF